MGTPVPNIYDYERVGSPSAARPITADDMIAWLKLDTSLSSDATFKAEMEALIDSAIHTAEDITNRVIQESTFRGYLDYFITGRTPYEVRKSPLQSVTSITYKVDGVDTTLDSAGYAAILSPNFSRVEPGVGYDWPSTVDDVLHAVTWTFIAGYPVGTVPEDLLTALKMHVASLWVHRGDCGQTTVSSSSRASGATGGGIPAIPSGAMAIYQLHRISDLRVGL